MIYKIIIYIYNILAHLTLNKHVFICFWYSSDVLSSKSSYSSTACRTYPLGAVCHDPFPPSTCSEASKAAGGSSSTAGTAASTASGTGSGTAAGSASALGSGRSLEGLLENREDLEALRESDFEVSLPSSSASALK